MKNRTRTGIKETEQEGMLKQVAHVVGLLSNRERRNLGILSLGTVFLALIEVLGVGSILPFITVASQPEIIHTNQYLLWIYNHLNFTSERAFLIFLGVGFLVFLVLTNLVSAFIQYFKVRFSSMRRHSLSLRLIKAYLGQPYHFFLNRDSYDFVKNINGEIQNMIIGTLTQFVEIISRSIQILFLVLFLIIMDPVSTLLVVGMVGVSYSVIYTFLRKYITKIGVERFEHTREISKIVSEAFWGIKEVKLLGIESTYADVYTGPSKKLAKNLSMAEVVGDVPKFALGTVAVSTIVIIVLYSISVRGGFANAASTVTLFGYAGFRIIPALQALFKALTKMRHSAPTAERLKKEFELEASADPVRKYEVEKLPCSRQIELRSVCFSYPGVERRTIDDVSLSIPVNSLVGFAGKTGSGKTTLVDIILGLLKIGSGEIIVDGCSINADNLRSWQRNLGYVPQNIYLFNDTIASNIAFGVPKQHIDMEAVKSAAKLAQINEFIDFELKNGYDTKVGERGVRLSGGQRQRIGIARALYRNPAVLVMDEATSALDNRTERAVMEAIDRLHGLKTIILIAHRLSTLKDCDSIYLFDSGKLVESGTYEELKGKNEFFM